ncbi:MAG: hypothetical protein ACXV5H_00365 [Halobacteriota archaeon]
MKEGRAGLLGAVIAMAVGALLIYISNNILSANTPGQALVAYVGVFVVVAGIIYGVTMLFDLRR